MRKAESYFDLDEAHQIANKMGYPDLFEFLHDCSTNTDILYAWYQCLESDEAARILDYQNDFCGHIPEDLMPAFISNMEVVAFGGRVTTPFPYNQAS